jgi:WD40 repeat protein
LSKWPPGSLYLWESEDLDFRNIEISRIKHRSNYGRAGFGVYRPSHYAIEMHVDTTGQLSVALSPDGATVATGSRSGKISVWELNEALETATVLSGHREPVTGLAWNPDGSILASAGAALCIWEPATRISRILTDHTAGLTGVQFSPDGTLIATSSHDNTVRIWGIG